VQHRSAGIGGQLKALEDAGCTKIYQEKISGVKADTPQLKRCQEGRKLAKVRSVHMGRPPKLTAYQRQEALARREAGETLNAIARTQWRRSHHDSEAVMGRGGQASIGYPN
jgi:hypothetical protein